MKENFKRKVIANGIYDTEKYRYWYDCNSNSIYRLPINYLGTTRAFSSWELIASNVI